MRWLPPLGACLLSLLVATRAAAASRVASDPQVPAATADSSVQRGADRSPPPTFTSDIAPLLFTRCATCHRPGGSAPFSLLTYQDARPRAAAIARLTAARTMPPWKAEPGPSPFIGQPHLSAIEIRTVERWAREGAPEGDPTHLPPRPAWSRSWQLGIPDLVLTPAETYTLPAAGSDRFRVFVLPIPVDARRYVRGLEFLPDDPRVTHHANILIDRTSTSRARHAADPTLGESGLLAATAEYPSGHLLGWTPGQPDPLLSKGLAWTLDPGTDLVVQLHMVPDGTPRPVRFSVGLFFTADPPERSPAVLRLGRRDIDIPAGQRAYTISDSYVLPVDVDVRALKPHAHYRAREVEARAVLPNGDAQTLLSIKDWDFRWQHVYRFAQPVALPKGTTLTLRMTYENGADSRRNPERPPRRVSWGPRSTDEMGDLWIQVVPREETDLLALTHDFQRKWTADEISGYETLVAADGGNAALREEAALLFLQAGRWSDAVKHYRVALGLRGESPVGHFNLATALLAAGRLDEAVAGYREALRLNPTDGAAHSNLGTALVRQGKADEALTHFRAAIVAEPTHAGAHNNVGQLLMARGELDQARPYLERSIHLNAGAADAHYNLGLVTQALGDWPTAVRHLRTAVEIRPGWTAALTALAWALAATPDDTLRDVQQAIVVAERAVALAADRSADTLDALAAAYAASGRFDRALATIADALKLAAGTPVESAMRERLALYEARRPYRR